jgi:hypothetical protein
MFRRSLMSNASLLSLTALVAISCQKKSSSSSSEDAKKLSSVTAAPPVATTSSTAGPVASPEGTAAPAGGLGEVRNKASFGVPPATVGSTDQKALQTALPELSKFVHLLSPLYTNFGVTFTDLQQKSSDCANSFMKTALLKATATGFTIEGGQDFVKCLNATAPRMSSLDTRNWQSSLTWSYRGNCLDHNFATENGLSLGHDDLVRHLCQTATAGEIYMFMEFESKELGDGGKVVSTMKRTRAILGNNSNSCNFLKDPATGARSYQDCLQFEKIERDGTAPLYMEASFSKDKAVGTFDAKGIRFSAGSQIDVKINNWQGNISFAGNSTVLPTVSLNNGTTTFEGKNLFPYPIEYKDNSTIFIDIPVAPTGASGPSGVPTIVEPVINTQTPIPAATTSQTPVPTATP